MWTKELMRKLAYYVEHPDYIVRVSGMVSNVTSVAAGWFGVDCGEDIHSLQDYPPHRFTVYAKVKVDWQDATPKG
jgi:hypothetical protein